MRLRIPICWVVATAVWGANPSPGTAGIVNVQSILATDARPGLSGAITSAADWRTGSTELLVLSAAPVARYQTGDHLMLMAVRGEFGRSGKTRIIAKTFEHLRYRYTVNSRLLGEIFTQHEYDQFRRLRLRALAGVGPKVNLIEREKFAVATGVAYMLEYEQLSTGSEIDAGTTDLAHRISSYGVGRYEVDDRIQLVETIYAQPRLTDLSDFRLLNESQFVVRVTDSLAVKTSFLLSYDAAPPVNVGDLETTLKSSITYSF